jgi:thioredoxin-dependent peroxiredoxin
MTPKHSIQRPNPFWRFLVAAIFIILLGNSDLGHSYQNYPSDPVIDNKTLLLGDRVPNFRANSQLGKIEFYDWMQNNWVILLSHPKSFTPVCTTELAMAAMFAKEFDKRGAKIIALSIDSLDDQKKWLNDINSMLSKPINFPIIADEDQKTSRWLGMIHPNSSRTQTVRSVFIIGPDRKLKVKLVYPATTGRSFPEILRTLDSVQLAHKRHLLTPADWQPGDEVLIDPKLSATKAREVYGEGMREVFDYLRYVKM